MEDTPQIQRRLIPVAEGCSAVMLDRPVDPNIEARKPREIPVGHYAIKASLTDQVESQNMPSNN